MQTILIIGAGKSSDFLIDYLLETTFTKNRKLIIADLSKEIAERRIKGQKNAIALEIDLGSENQRKGLIQKADVVVSMLPAHLHPLVAKDCLESGKHFFSASYESPVMRELSKVIVKKNLLFLNECGLDPGIDHMSAMRIIHREQSKGHQILSFKSYTGGLLATESEDNPWKYKFTWNPRNVVRAGIGISQYMVNGEIKIVPYHKLFTRLEKITVGKEGEFEGYPNRDSLLYRKVYGLENIQTILRGTLRRPGFCKAWNVFVQLGMTDDSFQIELPENFTKRKYLNMFLPELDGKSIEERLKNQFPWIDEVMDKLNWLGIFGDEVLTIRKGSPAEILLGVLEKKWQLNSEDKDMIIMQHLFEVKMPTGISKLSSNFIYKGESGGYTAMAKTVGFSLGIAVDLFLDGKIKSRGLQIPVNPEIYLPILEALERSGLFFEEKEI